MRVLQAEQRPRRTAQERIGMFSRGVMPWPQAGQRERGTNRLYVSLAFGWGGGAGEPWGSPALFGSFSNSAHSSRQLRSIILGSRWTTTLRNEPTTKRIARQTRGSTAGWATVLRVSLIRAKGAMSDRLADLEYRQVHRDDHAADHDAEHHHDHRLHQAGERIDRVVNLGLEEVRDLAEHRIERPGFLADRHHLDDHVGEDVCFLHRGREAGAGAHLPLDFLGGLRVHVVARCAPDRIERLHQWYAGGEHGGQRPGPARDRRLADQVAENRYLEAQAVHEYLNGHRALPQLEKPPGAADRDREYQVPELHEEVRDRHHEQRRSGKIGAEVREHLLERRDYEDHDHSGDDERDHDDRDRVEERRLDLRLDREDFLFVRRQAVEQRLENPGRLAGLHQVAEQRVEVQGKFPERRGERRTGLDVGLDAHQKSRHRRVGVSLADDVERLQQRHARLHHGRELPGEQRHVLIADPAAPADALLGDLRDDDALATQGDVDQRRAAGAH